MPRQRFRQWWRDQGLITIILLAISFLLAVAGWNKGSTGMTHDGSDTLAPSSVLKAPVSPAGAFPCWTMA